MTCTIIMLIEKTKPLAVLPTPKTDTEKNTDKPLLLKIIQGNRRYVFDTSGSAESLRTEVEQRQFAKLVKNALVEKQMLRNSVPVLEKVMDAEMKEIFSHNTTGLDLKPYLETKGHNDYIVLHHDQADPFVTVIPNDIYYNIEKKCVNWLDNCNAKGLREQLMMKVLSP